MQVLSSVLPAALAAILVSTAPLAAQGLTAGEGPLRSSGALTVGPVASINLPVGDFGDVVGTGFTLGAQVTYGLGVVTLLGEMSYSSFTGKNNLGSQGTFAFDAGARVGIPPSSHGSGPRTSGAICARMNSVWLGLRWSAPA